MNFDCLAEASRINYKLELESGRTINIANQLGLVLAQLTISEEPFCQHITEVRTTTTVHGSNTNSSHADLLNSLNGYKCMASMKMRTMQCGSNRYTDGKELSCSTHADQLSGYHSEWVLADTRHILCCTRTRSFDRLIVSA